MGGPPAGTGRLIAVRRGTARRGPRARHGVLIRGLIVVAALASACSSDSSEASAPHVERAGTSAEPREINVIMRDYLFQPTPIALVPGEAVRFNIINGGLLAHEFVLGDDAVQAAWASADAAATPPLPLASAPPASVPPDVAGVRVLLGSGEQTTVRYDVPRDTDLRLACHIPGHIEQGMVGEIRFVSVGPGGQAPGT